MSIRSPRDALLELRWTDGSLSGVSIAIIDRGSPDDRAIIDGPRVVHIGRSFMDLEGGTKVPFHRVIEVRKGCLVVWKRRSEDLDIKDDELH